MTFTRDNLPASYKPYHKLTVCSNLLIGGGHVVEIAGVLPLIIGRGHKPQIWLQAISEVDKKEFVSIVENSISKFSAVEVKEANKSLIITIEGVKVLQVRETSKSEAIVDILDLRPIGINLFGNSKSMDVGGGSFSKNSMSGGGVLLGFGD
jgi:hypothetical protein